MESLKGSGVFNNMQFTREPRHISVYIVCICELY